MFWKPSDWFCKTENMGRIVNSSVGDQELQDRCFGFFLEVLKIKVLKAMAVQWHAKCQRSCDQCFLLTEEPWTPDARASTGIQYDCHKVSY